MFCGALVDVVPLTSQTPNRINTLQSCGCVEVYEKRRFHSIYYPHKHCKYEFLNNKFQLFTIADVRLVSYGPFRNKYTINQGVALSRLHCDEGLHQRCPACLGVVCALFGPHRLWTQRLQSHGDIDTSSHTQVQSNPGMSCGDVMHVTTRIIVIMSVNDSTIIRLC